MSKQDVVEALEHRLRSDQDSMSEFEINKMIDKRIQENIEYIYLRRLDKTYIIILCIVS